MSHSVRVVVDSWEYSLNHGTTLIHCLFSDIAALLRAFFQSEIWLRQLYSPCSVINITLFCAVPTYVKRNRFQQVKGKLSLQ